MASIDVPLPKHLFEAIKEKRFSSCLAELPSLAAQGSVDANIALAHVFFYGGDGVQRDYGLARYWLEKINREDDLVGYAAYRLGIIYYKGLSVAANHRSAFQHFRRAALQGNRKSLLMVAAMQKEGDGTLKKPRTAKTIFRCCVKDRGSNIFMRLLAFLWMSPAVKRWASWQN